METDPYDDELYIELGKFVVSWSRVELLGRLLLAGLTGLPPDTALLLTSGLTTGRVLERCGWLAEALGDADEQTAVQAWVAEAQRALGHRNQLFHGGWVHVFREDRWTAARVGVRAKSGRVERTEHPVNVEDIREALEIVRAVLQMSDGLPFAMIR